jgi:hypothetical protein
MDIFTIWLAYKKHDGSVMNFAGVLLDSDVFDTVSSLRMFKKTSSRKISVTVISDHLITGVGTIAHKKTRGLPQKNV